jgi:dTDP-glucose 4,6-dehydratase
MSILITGNLGFLGTNLTLHLLKRDFKIIGVDRISYCSNLSALKLMKKHKKFLFYKADIKNTKLMSKLVKNVDMVINLAAFTHVDNSIKTPEIFVENNIVGFQRLLKVCAQQNKLLIHISTDEVYGEILRGEAGEENRFNPRNVYSATKAAEECLINAYKNNYGLKSAILRPCNVFGYWQYTEKLIPKTITLALEKKKIPVYGNGKQIREWLFCEDFNSAVELILEKNIQEGTYNVGSRTRKENIQVVKKILDILGKDYSLIKFVDDRPGHDRRYAINSQKIRSLGFRARFDFDAALEKTVFWYAKNRKK